MTFTLPENGRRRVIIESVSPAVDCGRFPAKRTIGQRVRVEADVFTDGHDLVRGVLAWRRRGAERWTVAPMEAGANDRHHGFFTVDELGIWEFFVAGSVDHLGTWQRDLRKRHEAGDELDVHLETGALLLEEAARHAGGELADELRSDAARLRDPHDRDAALERVFESAFATRTWNVVNAELLTRTEAFTIDVERERARFSSWYELFPRSASGDGRHGTFEDVRALLPYVAEMGFDVLYLPPVHPIGTKFRKGRNNAVSAGQEDVGSPWAVGGEDGGHKAIHPDLGTEEDFLRLVKDAESKGMEIAMDVAFQASPDHPLVREHPEFFLWRPDGTVQYAENPPKKYQDIYPFHFESDAWRALWTELASVFLYWIERGVKIFRVDNPHTKPLPFWEWLIRGVKDMHPDVIFLAEAFTRPKVMHRLAKGGFSQSYTYFTWRNSRHEIEAYMRDLTRPPVSDFFRPNFWPNTPDILPEFLQSGRRGAFELRVILAATLSSSYGIYGPAYELLDHRPLREGGEEYLDSEKYEIRTWNLDDPASLRPLLTRLNRIRRENRALQGNDGFHIHGSSNESVLCFSKSSEDGANTIVVVAGVDPANRHEAWIDLDRRALGIREDEPVQMHELLTGARFTWFGGRSAVTLEPGVIPAYVYQLRRRVRTERDFDYYL